jgi:hypothetical protein
MTVTGMCYAITEGTLRNRPSATEWKIASDAFYVDDLAIHR